MEETQSSCQNSSVLPSQQLYILLAFAIFGFFTNLASVTYLVKNFTLKKAIYQVLITDSIVNVLGKVSLVVESSFGVFRKAKYLFPFITNLQGYYSKIGSSREEIQVV